MSWGFYGREQELRDLRDILQRPRWFFARITARRRIGKTTLVQQALQAMPTRPVFYVQVPDSAPAGVLSAVHDAMETFGLDAATFPRPDSLLALARTLRCGALIATRTSSRGESACWPALPTGSLMWIGQGVVSC